MLQVCLLIAVSHAANPEVGVVVTPVDPQLASVMGLAPEEGAYVRGVETTGAGARAGIQEGDIILVVAHVPVRGPEGLESAIADAVAGQPLSLVVLRRGEQVALTVTGPWQWSHVRAPRPSAHPQPPESEARTETIPDAVVPEEVPTVDGAAPSGATPWWRGAAHFGAQLHYGGSSATMAAANRTIQSAQAALGTGDAEPFGFAHSVELSFVYETPWRVRFQVGAGGLYDGGSFDATAVLLDAAGNPIGSASVEITGHAWAVVVPMLVGYRLPVWQDRLSASVDVGMEILPRGGYGWTSDVGDSPGIVTPGASLGWTARAGVAWHVVDQLAVTLEVAGRGLRTGALVLEDDRDALVRDLDGNRVRMNFSGAGVRAGVTGYFF